MSEESEQSSGDANPGDESTPGGSQIWQLDHHTEYVKLGGLEIEGFGTVPLNVPRGVAEALRVLLNRARNSEAFVASGGAAAGTECETLFWATEDAELFAGCGSFTCEKGGDYCQFQNANLGLGDFGPKKAGVVQMTCDCRPPK